MGKPENADEFVQLEAEGVTVYVARQLLQKLEPGTRQMTFYIDGYGRFRLVFVEPWTEVERR